MDKYRGPNAKKQSTPAGRGRSTYAKQSSDYDYYQQQSQLQRQNQKHIQDQNYSNGILMRVLSTLESLEGQKKGRPARREEKLYGHYDHVRFDDKNYVELRSQLQTQLDLYKASRQTFRHQNPKNNYKLPNSFDETRLQSEISRYKKVFKDNPEISGMCADFERLANGHTGNLSYESRNYDVNYPEPEERQQRGQIFTSGIQAQKKMEDERKKVERLGVKRAQDLPIYLNHSGIRNHDLTQSQVPATRLKKSQQEVKPQYRPTRLW